MERKNSEANFETLSLKDKIKRLAIKSGTETTAHGIPNIINSDLIYLKIIWLIAFIVFIIICFVLVIKYIINFFDYETVVNVSIVTDSPAEFPAITICNLNPFYRKNAAVESYMNNVLANANISYSSILTSLSNGSSAINIAAASLALLKSSLITNKTLSSTDIENMGYTMSDMLLSCSFNGEKCSSYNFSYFYSYDYTNCYTFNSGYNSDGSASSIKTIGDSGISNGLEIELFTGNPTQDYFVYKSGAYVVVHNRSITPLMESEGVEIATGFQNNLGVTRTFQTNLPYPYSYCIDDATSVDSSNTALYQAIFNVLNQTQYRQKYCYKLCYQKSVIDKCECYDPSVANPFTFVNNSVIFPCEYSSSCMSKTKTQFQSTPITSQCSDQCPVECSFIYYQIYPSISLYPTEIYSSWLKLQTNVIKRLGNNTDYLSKGVLKLNVFYTGMDYTSISEVESTTWLDLIGNIGGQIGLFIGMSFLTLIEIVEFILQLIRIIYKHNQNKIYT